MCMVNVLFYEERGDNIQANNVSYQLQSSRHELHYGYSVLLELSMFAVRYYT